MTYTKFSITNLKIQKHVCCWHWHIWESFLSRTIFWSTSICVLWL